MQAANDHYAILGVAPDAPEHEIRAAYCAKALRFHPDKHEQQEANLFLAVQAAWETLRHPPSRSVYDAAARDSKLKRGRCPGPIVSVVDFSECTPVATDPGQPGLIDAYLYQCRCGDDHLIEADAFQDGAQTLQCASCSFSIRFVQ